jgi:hypothetical protein
MTMAQAMTIADRIMKISTSSKTSWRSLGLLGSGRVVGMQTTDRLLL